jgi:hypothetical protein
MRKYLLLAFSSLLFLGSCGGGGGGYSSGGGGPTGQMIAGPGPNVATMTVEIFQPGFVNIPYITLTICQPTTSNCATIDHVEVDTGSSGLRLMASAVPTAVLSMLPQQNAGATAVPVVECAQFADGFSWGPVVTADVTVSSEKASGIPIQIIGAPSPFNNDIPSSCSSTSSGSEEDTVALFGANGIIGVSDLVPDCPACATAAVAGAYYSCPTNGSVCSAIEESVASQVSNPVAFFLTDNNGVIVELPSVAAGGAASVTGALVFGIGTESNNGLGSASVLTADTTFGDIDVMFNGADYPSSFFDSGSNANYFTDNLLSVCAMGTAGAGFFCTAASLSAMVTGTNSVQVTASFTVGDATSMVEANPSAAALPQLAGPAGTNPNFTGVFDFGLSYFYGRNVFTAINGAMAGGTQGPYYAY